jgi:hypothetical protein
MHRILTEAGTVAALAVTLSAGYALLSNVLSQFSEAHKVELSAYRRLGKQRRRETKMRRR